MNMCRQKQKQPNKLAIHKYPDTYQLACKQLKHLFYSKLTVNTKCSHRVIWRQYYQQNEFSLINKMQND